MKMELLTRIQARVGTSTPKSNFFKLHLALPDIKCLALSSAAAKNLKETSLTSLPKPTPKIELSRDDPDLHTMCSPFNVYLETKEWKVVPGNVLSSRTKGKTTKMKEQLKQYPYTGFVGNVRHFLNWRLVWVVPTPGDSQVYKKANLPSQEEQASKQCFHGFCFSFCIQVSALNSCHDFPQWYCVT